MSSPERRKRLLVLSFSPIASDARVLKQVKHFVDEYDVTTCGYGEKPAGVMKHHQIPDDQPFRQHSRYLLVLRQYRRIYWATDAVVSAGAFLADDVPFDIILANDVETIGLALSLEPALGVHADIHEYAPRLNEEIPVWKLFVAPYIRWLCRRYLSRATSMTTVGQGIADEYQRVFGITSGIVTNAAPATDDTPTPVSSPIRIVHSGAALRNRGLEKMMLAVESSHARVSFDLFLMPNDLEYLDELKQLAEASERVNIHDPVPYSELIKTLNQYDLGIHVIPPVNFNNAWALPNKFFDYVQARLGIVIGPSPEMARTLAEYELGLATDGFEVEHITEALDSLSVTTVETWKKNAHKAAYALSAEPQVAIWDDAIAALAQRTPISG